MEKNKDFTTGKILGPLLKFAIPVIFALFLQAMYGAVDLLIVGKFASSADVSAVSTGSQLMQTITGLISSFSMAITVFIGQKIGEGKKDESQKIIGAGIFLFAIIGVIMSVLVGGFAAPLSSIMQAPQEAFEFTTDYIRICGIGLIAIIAYNLLGSIFRGFGDSRTPLITVFIACVCNIVGDFVLVAVFKMGTSGAAIATVLAQAISVLVSVLIVKNKKLIEGFSVKSIKRDKEINKKIIKIGTPIALQDFLVGLSFLIILAIVNTLGVTASAGVGVAEKLCTFIMLIPLAFMQSMSAFVAQNNGANKPERAIKALKYALMVSCAFGLIMAYLSFFHGDLLSGIFSNDNEVILSSVEYLKAYAIDCLFTCFLFCFIGFFNGMEKTTFVMIQGILGAFAVRVPVSFIMSIAVKNSLFAIGLATPCSSLVQIIICFIFFLKIRKKIKNTHTAETP